MVKALVAYASKHGSTAEIAKTIATMLHDNRLEVDFHEVTGVTALAEYDAVVLGSAIYSQSWMPEMMDFLTRRAQLLAQTPVWVFSSGPTGKGETTDLLEGWTTPAQLQPVINTIDPREVVVFHGRLDLRRLTLAELMLVKAYGGPLGDYRQWDAIKLWAQKIRDAIIAERSLTEATVVDLRDHSHTK